MATPQRQASGNHNHRSSVNSPVNNSHVESVTRSMSQVSLSSQTSSTELAKRPGFGTLGTPLKARVNFFPLDLSKTPTIFDHEILIHSKDKVDSQIRSRTRNRVIQLLLEKPAFKSAASDYTRRLVSVTQITSPQAPEYTCTIDFYEPEEEGPRTGGRSLQFKVLVKQTGQLSVQTLLQYVTDTSTRLPDSEKYISALNIFLSRVYSQNVNMVTSGRSAKFFNIGTNAQHSDLGFGLEVYQGYFRAVKPTINGLVLNFNTAAAVMIQTGLLHNIIKVMAGPYSQLSPERQIAILNGELRFLRVKHQFFGYPACKTLFEIVAPRRMKGGIVMPTARNVKFVRDKHPLTGQQEQREVTVAQHFSDAYPNTNRVDETAWVVDLGSRGRPNYVPSDLLTVIPGNLYRGLLPHSTQAAIMITKTCRRPGKNKDLIQNPGLRYLGVGVSNGPHDLFKINVGSQMMEIKARRLPPPQILFGTGSNDRSVKAAISGKWNLNGVKFKQPFSPVKVSWLELTSKGASSATNLQAFQRAIETGVRNYCDLNIKLVTIPGYKHSRELPAVLTRGMMAKVWQEMKKQNIKLVFVIIPNKSADNYSIIKTSGDVMQGMHTICTVSSDRSIKASVGEIANLLLKLNMKLGGVNLVVQPDSKSILSSLFARSIMFVGADVGHPAPGSMQGAPSIASIVATMDETCFRYAGSVRLQSHHDENKKSIEFILQFKDMMIEHLRSFYKRNNQTLPQTIVVYRDGVANNMFTECIIQELMQIKQACRTMYSEDKQPQIVFIVAQKRHHTRFYQVENTKRDGFDGNGNPIPGFIVDQTICDSRLWDWYLTSHQCLQGTSRSAHYTVLHNETDFSADQLQLLTYYQCWLLGRTNSSISIHPAARHADLLCDRARVYLRSVYVPDDPDQTYVAAEHWPGYIHGDVKDEMFWV